MLQLRQYNPIWLSRMPIAHRGLHGPGVPENSLAAFRAAASAGYAIELDIRVTGDGKLVVIHDPNARRMTGRNTKIASSHADELTQLRLGSSDESISLLDEVLREVAARVPLMVEVKTGSNLRALGAELRRLLASYDGEVALGSFDPRILLWMAHNMPDVPRIQIAGRIPEHRHPTIFKWVLRMMPLNPWTKPAAIAYDTRDLPSASLDFWSRRTGSYIIEWIVKTPEAYELATSRGHNVGFEVIRPEKRPS